MTEPATLSEIVIIAFTLFSLAGLMFGEGYLIGYQRGRNYRKKKESK